MVLCPLLLLVLKIFKPEIKIQLSIPETQISIRSSVVFEEEMTEKE